ncbi:hypothetical protein JTF08_11755 [Micrococcaceae bacterium RIT802]|nr:hypothetical protein [Micrococcaceae bacterium RIT 802]
MTERYSVTVAASSEQAKDWGRALADAVSYMAEHLAADDETRHESVFDKDFHLRILPNPRADGVEITVSWDPPDGEDVQA